MKAGLRAVFPILPGIAAGVILAFFDFHIAIVLFVAHGFGLIASLVSGNAQDSLIFSSGLGAGMVAVYMCLAGCALGGGGWLIGLGIGLLYGGLSFALACLGVLIGHLVVKSFRTMRQG